MEEEEDSAAGRQGAHHENKIGAGMRMNSCWKRELLGRQRLLHDNKVHGCEHVLREGERVTT